MIHKIFFYILTLWLGALLISGCKESNNTTKTPQTTFELLQGDWVTKKYAHGPGPFLMFFHIKIEDSLFTFISNPEDSVKFSLNGNQIRVFDSTNFYDFGKHQNYKIEKLDKEELILVVHSNKVRKRLQVYSWESDTLYFSKIQKKNDLQPVNIGFSSRGCFGNCPSMKIQLDENLNIKFFGGIYTDKEGGFSAKIDKETYCSIVDQIQCLPLDSLKSEYAAPWTDSQTRYITIETKDTVIKTKVYGTFLEPVELTILMNNLMSLYKRLNLTKN